MQIFVPAGELKIPRALEAITRTTLRTTINSTPLKARARNAVTEALRRGYIESYSGVSAAAHQTVCELTHVPFVRISPERQIAVDARGEDHEALVKLVDEKWMPMAVLANPERARYNRKIYVSLPSCKEFDPRKIYRLDMWFSGLPVAMLWDDLRAVLPNIDAAVEHRNAIADMWKAGKDITGEYHVGQD